jgi:hypothetical protein
MRKKKADGLTILVIVLAVLVMIVSMLLVVRRFILPQVSGRTRTAVIRRELRLGKRYLSEMEYDKAVTSFEKVVRLDEKNTAAYTGLGDAYTGMGEWTSAVENYDQAVITVAGVLPGDGAPEQEIRDLVSAAQAGGGPVQSSLGDEMFDDKYVIDVVIRRDDALENGLAALDGQNAGDDELIGWLEQVGHRYYQPRDEKLRERVGAGTAGTAQDTSAILEREIKDLADKYGVLPLGDEGLEVQMGMRENGLYMDIPGESLSRDTGLLAADIYDYDGDGIAELLTIRREPIVEGAAADGTDGEQHSGVYVEIYESTAGGCLLSDSRQLAVSDGYSPFFQGCSFEFFRCTDSSGRTFIYAESYIIEQDHVDDVSVLAFSYDGNAFSGYEGARFGYWFDQRSAGIYFVPASEEAAMHMSGFASEEGGWRVVTRPEGENNENSVNAFTRGIGDLGLELLHRRRNRDYSMTADECYAPSDGEMIRIGRMCLSHISERDDYPPDMSSGYCYFLRERTDCIGLLTSLLQAQSPQEQEQAPQEEIPQEEEPQEEEVQEEAEQDLTMEGIGLSYGHYDGVKPQGDGAIPTELDLNRDGTFRLHCIFPLFSQSDPEDSDYEYTYTGTWSIDRINEEGNAVLAFQCSVTDFEMTWDGSTLRHEDFFVY